MSWNWRLCPNHPIDRWAALREERTFTRRQFFEPTRTSGGNDVCLRSPLRFRRANLNGRQWLRNGREKALYFFPQVRDRLAIAREVPQQAALEETIKQRIERARRDGGLPAAK